MKDFLMALDPEDEKPEPISYRAPGIARATAAKSEPPIGKRLGIDFLASLAACAIVGALADRAFGTFPWGFLGLMGFGLLVGVLNAWRAKHSPARTLRD